VEEWIVGAISIFLISIISQQLAEFASQWTVKIDTIASYLSASYQTQRRKQK
jgi:hypothetical protein